MQRKYALLCEKYGTLRTQTFSAELAECNQKRDVDQAAQVLCPFG